MFLSDSSVARPIAMSCLIIALSLLGINAYRKLGLELMPKIDVPFVTVSTLYPGATPADIEVDVVKRIEDAVASVDGLKHMTSSCLENVGQVVMEFSLETDVDVAANDVRQKVDAIRDDFPSGVENPVIFKVDINALPIVTLAFTGSLSIEELYDYADQELSDRLSSIAGVANVELIGGATREIHVILDREKVAAAGLSSLDVVNALEQGVLTLPAGRIKDSGNEYNIRFDAEYEDFKAIGDLQVAGHDGARRYIRDLGHVEVSSDEVRQATYIDGRPAIGIKLVKRADANAVEVVREVKRQLARVSSYLPGGSELVMVSDEAEYIEASFQSTSMNVIQGVLLTAIILFFFLFNLRSTLVVAITMPLTIIISVFAMQLSGFTFNNSTLLALGLSVGTLVTNSIVVLESIAAQLESGAKPWDAAKNGANDVAVAVLASAGTNIVVLLPIGIMGTMVGMFFKPFAMTTLYANVVSLFISFTLTPILCGVILKPVNPKSILSRLGGWMNGIIDSGARKITHSMRYLGRHRWAGALAILITVGILVHALSMVPKVGFAMFPELDKGHVIVKMEYPTQQNLEQTKARVKEAENILADLPGLRHTLSSIGNVKAAAGNPSEGTFLASLDLYLVNKTQRPEKIFDIMETIVQKLQDYPDCVVSVSLPNLLGQESIPVTVAITGDDTATLDSIALHLQKLLQTNPSYIRPTTSVRAPRQELRIAPSRAILADAGYTATQLGGIIRTNLEGTKAAQYKAGARSYDIRVKLEEETGVRQIEEFQVPLGDGQSVLLQQYASIRSVPSPVIIGRYDKMRMAVLFSFLHPALPLGTAMTDIRKMVDDSGIMPTGYAFTFLGMGEMMGETIAAFSEALLIAIVLTYLVLAAVLESFTRPFYIMITIPLALIGIVWALRLSGMPINMFVLLGAVLLIGIVVNNAVLIIDHMLQLVRKDKLDPGEAMLMAVSLEFRPVVMITIAAALGMLPLAIASGLGGEMTVGIGMSSVGGVIVSGILTLIVIPIAFILFNPPRRDQEDDSVYEKIRRTSSRVFHKP